jgi:RNA polymerase sigma factor (sigma-70 family)
MHSISDPLIADSSAVATPRNRPQARIKAVTLEPPVRTAMLAAMPRLRAFAISLCRNGDQAEDLVQDTLLRACANIVLFTPDTNMLAWLCTILKNHFYSECRRRRRPFEAIDDHADSIASKPAQIAHAECNELWAALAKLEPKQREAIIMEPPGFHMTRQRRYADVRRARSRAESIEPERSSLSCCRSRVRKISKKIASLPQSLPAETVQR